MPNLPKNKVDKTPLYLWNMLNSDLGRSIFISEDVLFDLKSCAALCCMFKHIVAHGVPCDVIVRCYKYFIRPASMHRQSASHYQDIIYSFNFPIPIL